MNKSVNEKKKFVTDCPGNLLSDFSMNDRSQTPYTNHRQIHK